MSVDVKDFRGAPEPTDEEAAAVEAQRAADEAARRAAAAKQHAHLYAPASSPTARLNSGHAIPLVGLGTWCGRARHAGGGAPDRPRRGSAQRGRHERAQQRGVGRAAPRLARGGPAALRAAPRAAHAPPLPPRKSQKGEVRAAVVEAVRAGYRHIDAAAVYGNEEEVGLRRGLLRLAKGSEGRRGGGAEGGRRGAPDRAPARGGRRSPSQPPPPPPPTRQVGEALEQVFSEGVVSRADLFVTSKLWNSEHGAGRARGACLKTLRDLRLQYLDLYLIHVGRGEGMRD
jgi:hypothetical protein